MRFAKLWIGILFITVYPQFAFANDTAAVITTSGIEFAKSADIAMESEDLYISKGTIKVKYTFINESDHDITGIVTFPLPPINNMEPNGLLKLKDGTIETNEQNPFYFSLRVNGHETPVTIDQKDSEGYETIALDCNKENQASAKVYHVTMNNKTRCEVHAPYSSQYNYYWTQIFPSKKPITIEHEYLSGAGTGYEKTAQEDIQYCVDSHFDKALQKKAKEYNAIASEKDRFVNGDFSAWLHYNSTKIAYILKTGANWKDGHIRHFKMTIDKGTPNDLLSLCWPEGALKKISSTKFIFEKDNFAPTHDLDILIIDDKLPN